ncbi:hypothetical protein M426DRAFT_322586 [Hypoxylon sp. CI-4A]|nr:hypothetical protein M426DRAFT_322586 [Hypoxylon sp. CI-4A]
MPDYNISSAEEENRRLEQGTEVVRTYMDGKVFLAPVDTTRSGLKVLDSAASNGYWLSQFQAALQDPGSATLIGTDIQDRFPDPPRPGVAMRIQDINAPWPAEWKGTFDFAHQTLVLFQAGPGLREVLTAFAELVKPGGWIELMEPNYTAPEIEIEHGPAHTQFLDMLGELWALRNTQSDFAAGLEAILRDAGFVDVKSVLLPVGFGAAHRDPELREVSVESIMGGAKNMELAGKMIPGGLKCISKEDFDTWPARFEEELRSRGATMPMRVVYGRKPEA